MLRMRPYAPGDAAALHAAAIESVAEVQPWMPWCHARYSLDEAQAWVAQQIASHENQREFEFVVVDSAGRLLGGCGLNQIDSANRRANLGYWIRSSASGHSHATAAVRMLVQWAYDHTALERLEVVVATGNAASLRVAEKAGAFRECVLRHRLLLHGVFHDAVLFSFIRGENMAG